jgi:hypothetical protein
MITIMQLGTVDEGANVCGGSIQTLLVYIVHALHCPSHVVAQGTLYSQVASQGTGVVNVHACRNGDMLIIYIYIYVDMDSPQDILKVEGASKGSEVARR